ncbi:hypothetical protein [Lacicoccus alkaliphilus]|uniref:Uncharacterized protein n=1 Tax=Lacicoccus alkaliphilus DSM 16010 TaxID=1123231 RepID=A0A1M7EJF7_9BACL|nr:hypothetical protein [Salinicoccus alkaliphilus]SHL91840.1 hypothetical protein SAMN02745189_01243 [Salinicoccus alkaliphilus DSM 16010]
MYILLFVLFAGLIFKSFHTHYISKRKRYFSFDDSRYTGEDDFLKISELNIRQLERIFLYLMLATYLAALAIFIFTDSEMAIWVLATVLAWQFVLSAFVDLKLYSAFHDKGHLFMVAVWLLLIVVLYYGLSRFEIVV